MNFVNDDEFEEHEQLGSLIAAESKIVNDVLILFGDILFDSNILNQILNSKDDIEIFNKKAIYLYLREITGLNTKQIVSQLNKMRKKYRHFKCDWKNGKI